MRRLLSLGRAVKILLLKFGKDRSPQQDRRDAQAVAFNCTHVEEILSIAAPLLEDAAWRDGMPVSIYTPGLNEAQWAWWGLGGWWGWKPTSTSAILREELTRLGYKVKPYAWNVVIVFSDEELNRIDENVDGRPIRWRCDE